MQLPRCEASQTARGTGRCQMRVVGPGETLCRFHHPLHRTQTLADLERRKARYWEAIVQPRSSLGTRWATQHENSGT
jgi:hypothetical protein